MTKSEAQVVAKQNNMAYFETSAKDNIGIDELFHTTMYRVIFSFSILLYIAIIAALIYYRKAFQRTAEQDQIESLPPL